MGNSGVPLDPRKVKLFAGGSTATKSIRLDLPATLLAHAASLAQGYLPILFEQRALGPLYRGHKHEVV